MLLISVLLMVVVFKLGEPIAALAMAIATFDWLLALPFTMLRNSAVEWSVAAFLVVTAVVIPSVVLLLARLAEAVVSLAGHGHSEFHDPCRDPSCRLSVAAFSIPMIAGAVAVIVRSRRPRQNL